MPAPTFTLTQTIPTCGIVKGIPNDETVLDGGPIEVHATCCRSYGASVTVDGRLLHIEGGPYSACTGTGNGVKTYSSNSFRICRSTVSATFAGSHSGGGAVVGANFSGTAPGTLTGGITGAYTVTISGTMSGPADGTFSGTISGTITGTFTGSIVGGVVSVLYTITNPPSTTITSTGDSFAIGGGGTTFTFSGSFNGVRVPLTVNAYLELVWTHCEVGGIVMHWKDADDDAILASYSNLHYSVLKGRHTILNRTSTVCDHDHPCTGILTALGVRNLNPPASCFFGGSVTTCLGGPRPAEFQADVISSGSTALTDWAIGATNSGVLIQGAIPVVTTSAPGIVAFTITGDFWDSPSFGDLGESPVLVGATLTGSFQTLGGRGFAQGGNVGVVARPCTAFSGRAFSNWLLSLPNDDGAPASNLVFLNGVQVSFSGAVASVSTFAALTEDYCGGPVSFLDDIATTGSTYLQLGVNGVFLYFQDTGYELQITGNGVLP